MTILQLAQWPWVTRIRIHGMGHLDASGTPVHGSAAAVAAAGGNQSRNQAPRLSKQIRDVITATAKLLQYLKSIMT